MNQYQRPAIERRVDLKAQMEHRYGSRKPNVISQIISD